MRPCFTQIHTLAALNPLIRLISVFSSRPYTALSSAHSVLSGILLLSCSELGFFKVLNLAFNKLRSHLVSPTVRGLQALCTADSNALQQEDAWFVCWLSALCELLECACATSMFSSLVMSPLLIATVCRLSSPSS
ncbi:hypothetical protein D3C72_1992030 [compost metagenome]